MFPIPHRGFGDPEEFAGGLLGQAQVEAFLTQMFPNGDRGYGIPFWW
jgi:hypothetical protein